MAERRLDELTDPDIVLVPGGPGEVAARAGGPMLEWLREADRTRTWTTSVCTGSLGLRAPGPLRGRRGTTPRLALQEPARLGGGPVAPRGGVRGQFVPRAGRDGGRQQG